MTPAEDPRALMQALADAGADQDELMGRLVGILRDLVDTREELESLMRRHTVTNAARTSFIAEAATLIAASEASAEIVALSRYRRPKLRIVQ